MEKKYVNCVQKKGFRRNPSEKVWGYPDNPYRNGKQVAIGDEAHGRIALGFSRAMGELYEEVRMDHKFDYPTIEKVIDENVPSHWFIFVSWIKGIIKIMAG